jgi:hypothetical protein
LEYSIKTENNEWTDPTTVITIKNPQFLKQDSYIFGKTPFKNITIKNDSVIKYRVVGTDKEGITEYQLKEETLIYKQRKGLK